MYRRIEVKRYEGDQSARGKTCSIPSLIMVSALHRLTCYSSALDMPFLLLPFRPTSDPSAARTFIRNFFDRGQRLYGEGLAQELRLTEPMVSSIGKMG
jgi:hypothetical protein